MLEAREIGVSMGGRPVLESVGLSVPSGRVTGLVGPNGAGKTTLIRVLAGLRPPDSGAVILEGRPLAEFSRPEIARRVAVVFQSHPPIAGFRVRDIVEMGRFPHIDSWRGPRPEDREAVDRALDRAGLRSFEQRPHHELSGGEQQLVQLARALAQSPRVLLMDEPAANLDLRNQRSLCERLRALAADGLGVLVSAHDLNLVSMACDSVAVLSGGEILAQGAPSEVLSAEVVGRAFGVVPEMGTTSTGRRVYLF
jgi:iron complex transport system ATP-binding protein